MKFQDLRFPKQPVKIKCLTTGQTFYGTAQAVSIYQSGILGRASHSVVGFTLAVDTPRMVPAKKHAPKKKRSAK